MGGKVWKEEEEEEGCWREGVAGAGPQEHLSGNRPGEVLAAGRGRPALAQGCPQPCLPCQGTCGCPALPPAGLEVFQSIPALEAFKDSLPMHRRGLGSPPVPRQERRVHTKPHPKCKAEPRPSSDAPSTSSKSHKLPQHLLAAHPRPRTPTGHRQGHPGLPQSVWYTLYLEI